MTAMKSDIDIIINLLNKQTKLIENIYSDLFKYILFLILLNTICFVLMLFNTICFGIIISRLN